MNLEGKQFNENSPESIKMIYAFFKGIPGEENPPIFSCEASNDEEAEEMFKAETGKSIHEVPDLVIGTATPEK
jgi:hypothetical protein